MTDPARARRLAVTVLVALLALGHLQATLAVVGIIWRASRLSWDSPATQLVEEIASAVVPVSDPSRLAAEHLAVARAAPGRVLALEDRGDAQRPALSERITRAPPV
jgi:hypothetical protein